jgi:hypothetical protein
VHCDGIFVVCSRCMERDVDMSDDVFEHRDGYIDEF